MTNDYRKAFAKQVRGAYQDRLEKAESNLREINIKKSHAERALKDIERAMEKSLSELIEKHEAELKRNNLPIVNFVTLVKQHEKNGISVEVCNIGEESIYLWLERLEIENGVKFYLHEGDKSDKSPSDLADSYSAYAWGDNDDFTTQSMAWADSQEWG